MAEGYEPKPFESCVDATTTDLNTCTNTGFYSWGPDSANNPTPGATNNGNMLVIKGYAFIHQIAFAGNTDIYMRRKSSSSWNEWKHSTFS